MATVPPEQFVGIGGYVTVNELTDGRFWLEWRNIVTVIAKNYYETFDTYEKLRVVCEQHSLVMQELAR